MKYCIVSFCKYNQNFFAEIFLLSDSRILRFTFVNRGLELLWNFQRILGTVNRVKIDDGWNKQNRNKWLLDNEKLTNSKLSNFLKLNSKHIEYSIGKNVSETNKNFEYLEHENIILQGLQSHWCLESESTGNKINSILSQPDMQTMFKILKEEAYQHLVIVKSTYYQLVLSHLKNLLRKH